MVGTTESPRRIKTGLLIRRRKDGRRQNALSSGLRSSLGLLPPSARFISRRRNTACRELTAEIRRVHRREPNWHELETVQEYREWYTFRELLKNWINIAGHEMTADELLGYQRKAAHASTVLRTIRVCLGLNQVSQAPSLPSRPAEPLTPEREAAIRAAAELNKRAIAQLEAQERQAEYLSRLASGSPDDTHGGLPVEQVGFADGPQAGAPVGSVANLDADDANDAAGLDAGDEVGDEA
jgi:hypothetical protein